MKINKAKIKNKLFLYYEYSLMAGDVNYDIKTSSDAPIHDDLRNAFRNLIPHFAFLCEEIGEYKMMEFIDGKSSPEDEFYIKYSVNQFSIGGSGDSEGITLSGNKRVGTGVVNFNTPFLRYSDEYEYMNEFIAAIETAKDEVRLYIDGKHAPKAQQEMVFDDFDSEEEICDDVAV